MRLLGYWMFTTKWAFNSGDKRMRDDVIQRFIGIPGHRVSGIYFLDEQGLETDKDDQVAEVMVELSRENHPFTCPCGRRFQGYYDFRERFVRDLPWGPWGQVFLMVPRFRVCCPDCGVKTEPLDWIPERCRYTRRLADAVALACREVRSIQAIAETFGLSWEGLRVSVVTTPADGNPVGIVYNQLPAADTELAYGATVDLFVPRADTPHTMPAAGLAGLLLCGLAAVAVGCRGLTRGA